MGTKKRIINSFLFVVILLVGAWAVTAIQGDLSSGGFEMTTPANDTIVGKGNYTFEITLFNSNQTNMTNWSMVLGTNSAVIYLLGIDIQGDLNSTNITNDTTIWSVADGIYNVTVNASNGTGFVGDNSTVEYTVYNITFDTSAPYGHDEGVLHNLTNFVFRGAGMNQSENITNGTSIWDNGTIVFEYTAFDLVDANAFDCHLIVDGLNQTAVTTSNGTRVNTNVSGLNHGWHDVNVSCVDQAGNSNNTISDTYRFYVNDTKAPTTPTLLLAAVTVRSGVETTFTCSGSTDTVDTAPTYTIAYKHQTLDSAFNENTGASFAFTSSDAGTYDVKCKSSDDNSHSSSYTEVQTIKVTNPSFVDGGGSSSGSGSSSTTPKEPVEVSIPAGESKDVGSLDAVSEAIVSMASQSTATFSVAGEAHSAVVKSLTETSAVITISSDPVDVELAVEETKELDLDGDGVNDLSVTLVSIEDGVANVTFKSLVPTPADSEDGTTGTTGGTTTTTDDGSSLWWLWTLIIIVIIGVGVYFFLQKKN
jgi:hypothetical protein